MSEHGEHDGRGPADLSPREPRPVRRGRVLPSMAIALVVVGIAGLLVKTLGDASLFFKNADEAVEERDRLGDRRFRVQGSVVPGTVTTAEVDSEPAVLFTISYNQVELDVVHLGNPPQLFKDDMPVVLEGRWVHGAPAVGSFTGGVDDGWYFSSDRMLVKHDNEYISVNEARLRQAEDGGTSPAPAGNGYQE